MELLDTCCLNFLRQDPAKNAACVDLFASLASGRALDIILLKAMSVSKRHGVLPSCHVVCDRVAEVLVSLR
jgi:hypothetical protein